MPIKIGTDTISERQGLYLKECSKAPPEMRARYLAEALGDASVQSGEENLHPDWVDVYLSTKDVLSKVLPSRLAGMCEQVMAELTQDTEIGTIDPQATRLVFLLGAGASKPKPSDIPTVKELLPDLLARARRLDRADLQKLADFCEVSHIDNIEDLLTAAQLSEFCTRNPSVLRLVDFLIYRRQPEQEESFYRRARSSPAGDLSAVAFLQDTLQVLFGLLSSRMLPAQPNSGHLAIANYAKNVPQSAIITTNYDCCMDLALQSQNAHYSYLVEFARRNMAPEHANDSTSLIKLHGSLNWFYCETCQQVHLIDIERTVKEYLNDESCYSVIAVCKDCGGQRRGLLVPPLAMKFDVAPPLTPLIERAQACFNHAEAIVVVGFSFADADLYISRMLTKSMQLNQKVRVIVFDPDRNVSLKLRRQLSLRIPRFDEKRVVRVTGDCASTLPAFLEGKLKRPSGKDSKERPRKPAGTSPPGREEK